MYTEQLVSFIDILGFKNLIKSKNCEEILKIHDAFYKVNKQEGEDLSGLTKFKMINFSDCIVRCRPSNNVAPPFFCELSDLLNIQWQLIYHDVLIRGAVTIGDIYVNRTDEKATVFGKALNEAYRLESKKAKYPRIIVDESVLEAIPTEYKNDLLKQDDSDGYYFINYLNCKSEMWQQNQGKHYLTFLTRHKKVCEKLLEEGTQEEDENKRKKLKEKGDWLKKYHNDHIYRCIFQLTIRPELEQELEITTLELKNKLLTD